VQPNWEVLKAATREVLEAYHEAVVRGDVESAEFWRPIVVERLVLIRGAFEHYHGASGADSSKP
jgi:hypothetical protein